jgi:hypothetical protein
MKPKQKCEAKALAAKQKCKPTTKCEVKRETKFALLSLSPWHKSKGVKGKPRTPMLQYLTLHF